MIRTRFAPSPTGHLHIGGVRTALFNWLLARHSGGAFILRIDDTDLARHVPGALERILEGFRWLGMDWDEGPEVGGPHAPYFQSQRTEKYRDATERLAQSGAAYRCYCTPEEIEAERRESRRLGHASYRYSGRCRRLSDEQRRRFEAEGRTWCLRFAVPEDQPLEIDDLILGPTQRHTKEIGDFVIVRPDGSALYNFATVVDDADMEITHVIRAQEHLSNTWPQLLVYRALGRTPPLFAHVPYVAKPGSTKKLSKRDPDIDFPVTLEEYRAQGYLPEAVMNYLARLGWSLDEKREKIGRDELIAHFSLERVNKSPASFDPDKLYWLEGEYMRELPLDEKIAGVIPFLRQAGLLEGEAPDEPTRNKIARVVEACGDRLKTFSDIVTYGDFFFRPEVQYDQKAVQSRLRKADVPALLEEFRNVLAESEPFVPEMLEERLRLFADQQGVGAGKIIHALRVSTTGKPVGPGVFDCLAILGKETTLERIDQALQMLRTSSA